MRKQLIIAFIIITSFMGCSPAWSQVEELVHKDSCYIAKVDGVFLDLDSYVEVTYELEKIEALKLETPSLKVALDSLKTLHDSTTAAQMAVNKKTVQMLHLERQSKTALKQRVFNLQHNYNVMERKKKRATRQRNSLGAVALALIAGILIL